MFSEIGNVNRTVSRWMRLRFRVYLRLKLFEGQYTKFFERLIFESWKIMIDFWSKMPTFVG